MKANMKYLKYSVVGILIIIAAIYFISLDEINKRWISMLFFIGWTNWMIAESIDKKNNETNRRLEIIIKMLERDKQEK